MLSGEVMKDKLSCEVKKIKSRILVKFEGNEAEYESGAELADVEFDKYYLIDSITAENDMVVLTLVENTKINDISWNNNDDISFF